jgi:hypothetical protein
MVARAEQPAVAVVEVLGGVVGAMERSLPSFSQGLADTGLIRGVSD